VKNIKQLYPSVIPQDDTINVTIKTMKNILFIDTSKQHIVSVKLVTDAGESVKETEQKFGSQVLLHLIEEVLAENKLKMVDLGEVLVETGPGSFTGLRVGVAIANAIGYSLNIPVNGKKMETELIYS